MWHITAPYNPYIHIYTYHIYPALLVLNGRKLPIGLLLPYVRTYLCGFIQDTEGFF